MRDFLGYVLSRTAACAPVIAALSWNGWSRPDFWQGISWVFAAIAVFWALVFILTALAKRLTQPAPQKPPSHQKLLSAPEESDYR